MPLQGTIKAMENSRDPGRYMTYIFRPQCKLESDTYSWRNRKTAGKK
jgi:hypothetical protein